MPIVQLFLAPFSVFSLFFPLPLCIRVICTPIFPPYYTLIFFEAKITFLKKKFKSITGTNENVLLINTKGKKTNLRK